MDVNWFSKQIPKGGLFHPRKVEYSHETHQMLKNLMEESKLTMMQRNKLNYFLRSGDSLPSNTSKPRQSRRTIPLLAKPCKRRSRSTIIESGVYEIDQFKPVPHKFDREIEKARLQSLMSYGQLGEPPAENSKNNKKRSIKFENRFDELKNEIDERIEWLTEMEAMGQAEPHRQVIKEQIAIRIREMEKLKPTSS